MLQALPPPHLLGALHMQPELQEGTVLSSTRLDLCRGIKDNHERVSTVPNPSTTPQCSTACGTLQSVPKEVRQPTACCLFPPAFPLAEHLRSSLNDRMDLIIQKAKPKLQDGDDISHLDIQLKIEDFISRMQQVLGQPFPLQIMEKLCMFRELFLIVTST